MEDREPLTKKDDTRYVNIIISSGPATCESVSAKRPEGSR